MIVPGVIRYAFLHKAALDAAAVCGDKTRTRWQESILCRTLA
jgi:hypothetical protein